MINKNSITSGALFVILSVTSSSTELSYSTDYLDLLNIDINDNQLYDASIFSNDYYIQNGFNEDNTSDQKMLSAMIELTNNLINESKKIEPSIMEVIDDNFWEML